MTKMLKPMQFQVLSFTAFAQTIALPWPTPMRQLMKNPEGGDFVWRRFTYIFGLPDPRAFRSPVPLEPAERAALVRFVQHAERLAQTTLLTANDRMGISADAGEQEPSIETTFSDPDATVGYMVLLRQCYADGEDASFSTVRKILGRCLHDDRDDASLDILRQWAKAHAALRNKSSEELVQEQMIREGRMPPQIQSPDGSWSMVRPPASPAEMLRTFWYGDQVHWGDRREALNAVLADPFAHGFWEIEARQAAADFGHLYLGFALLAKRALGD